MSYATSGASATGGLHSGSSTLMQAKRRPEHPENVTLYHVNQAQFPSGQVGNMNTGDLLGDLYFVLYGFMAPIECSTAARRHSIPGRWQCSNPEAANSSNLVVTQLVLTVGSHEIGAYQRCNVVSNTSTTAVGRGEYRCRCSHVGGLGVGKQMGCNATVGTARVVNATTSKHFRPNSTSPEYLWWLHNLARYANGRWWSTLSAGECTGAGGCSWRVVTVGKRIYKPCLEAHLMNAVVARNTSCFSQCNSRSGGNASDPCFTRCFFGTVLGSRGGTEDWQRGLRGGGGGMPVGLLIDAWHRAFAPSGCPSVRSVG
jgi:hypothetical protein